MQLSIVALSYNSLPLFSVHIELAIHIVLIHYAIRRYMPCAIDSKLKFLV